MGYWGTELEKEASDKSFSYGIRITHDGIEGGKTYDAIKSFLMDEKHFEAETIGRMFEIVKKKRRDMVDSGGGDQQEEDAETEEETNDAEEFEDAEEVDNTEMTSVDTDVDDPDYDIDDIGDTEERPKEKVRKVLYPKEEEKLVEKVRKVLYPEEKEAQVDVVKSVEEIISKVGSKPFIKIANKDLLPIAQELKANKSIRGFAIFAQDINVDMWDDVGYEQSGIDEEDISDGFSIEDPMSDNEDGFIDKYDIDIEPQIGGVYSLTGLLRPDDYQVVVVSHESDDIYLVSDANLDFKTNKFKLFAVTADELEPMLQDTSHINVFDVIHEFYIPERADEIMENIQQREGFAFNNKGIKRHAQSPSPWEPGSDSTTRDTGVNQWMNMSWDGLMDSSRNGKDFEDLRDVPLETRMWPQHTDLSDIQLEKKLDEAREGVDKIDVDMDSYWGDEQAKTLEGRMVEQELNETPETWYGDVPQLEKRRISR